MSTGSLKELQSALQIRLDRINEGMAKGVSVDGENVSLSPETAKQIKSDYAEALEIKSLVDMQNFTGEVKSSFEAPTGGSAALASYVGGLTSNEIKSIGEAFTDSDEFKSFQETGRLTMDNPFQIKAADISRGGGLEQKDVFSSSGSSTYTRQMGAIQFDPTVPRAYRQTRVRDLFPVSRTSASVIDYFRVLGYVAGDGAKSVRDRTAPDGTAPTGGATDVFGKKPHTRLRFESKQAPVRTIAHWEAAHRNVLADVPQLRSTIDTELLYGLRLEEDRQILSGSGQNDELLGLLNTPGIQPYAAEAGDRYSDALRKAATLCMLANYQATGYVMHPFDWEKIETQKASGDGQYMLVSNIAVGAGSVAWRQPVVETPAIAEGTFLTGAFGLGAQLYDREDANVRISEHHEDFFVRNAIVILVEERLAMAVKRPESFVKGDFTLATA